MNIDCENAQIEAWARMLDEAMTDKALVGSVDMSDGAEMNRIVDKLTDFVSDMTGYGPIAESDEYDGDDILAQGSEFRIGMIKEFSGTWYGGFHDPRRESPDEEAGHTWEPEPILGK